MQQVFAASKTGDREREPDILGPFEIGSLVVYETAHFQELLSDYGVLVRSRTEFASHTQTRLPPDTSNPSSSVNIIMNAIADALGMGKLPSPVLYIVVGLVSDSADSVGFIRLLGHFSYHVRVLLYRFSYFLLLLAPRYQATAVFGL